MVYDNPSVVCPTKPLSQCLSSAITTSSLALSAMLIPRWEVHASPPTLEQNLAHLRPEAICHNGVNSVSIYRSCSCHGHNTTSDGRVVTRSHFKDLVVQRLPIPGNGLSSIVIKAICFTSDPQPSPPLPSLAPTPWPLSPICSCVIHDLAASFLFVSRV